jgi:hypothetical protein
MIFDFHLNFTGAGSLPLAVPGPPSRTAAKPRRARLLRRAVVLIGALMACGNYSNEDLEYMNAVPATAQLAATLPAYSTTLPLANEAELAQTTHSVTDTFNQMLDNALGAIDAIRAYEPTSRTATSRIWGPFPSDKQPGWDWRLTVSHDDPQSTVFTYELDVENTAAGGWLTFLTGTFDATQGVRRGAGTMTMDTATLTSAGFPFDQGTAPFLTLTVSYQTASTPNSIIMTITRMADAANEVSSVVYTYLAQADGSGQVSFTLTGNLVPGPATETVAVTSGWLANGAGMATLQVEQGDGAGLTQTECWDATFVATYNDKPWSTPEDVGVASDCPVLPTF